MVKENHKYMYEVSTLKYNRCKLILACTRSAIYKLTQSEQL